MADIFVDRQHDIVIFKASGTLSSLDLVEAVKSNYPSVSCHVIWDFSDCSQINISQNEFSTVIEYVKQLSANRVGGKTAYVSGSDFGYGMSRMFSIMSEAEVANIVYACFKRHDDAVDWLRS